MSDWSKSIQYALGMMSYHPPYDQQLIESIRQHWGDINEDVCEHILLEGEKDDKLFALFVLANAVPSRAHKLLLPLLQSTQRLERWASALELGRMQEELAFPLLLQMLTEFLPAVNFTTDKVAEWRYEIWRCSIPLLLANWKHPFTTSSLRNALQETLLLEQASSTNDVQREVWKNFQMQIIYTLGRLESFGTLTGLTIEENKLNLWMVHMIIGSLYERLSEVRIRKWRQASDIHETVKLLLAHHFGLNEESQEKCLTLYERKMLSVNYRTYYEEQALQEKGDESSTD